MEVPTGTVFESGVRATVEKEDTPLQVHLTFTLATIALICPVKIILLAVLYLAAGLPILRAGTRFSITSNSNDAVLVKPAEFFTVTDIVKWWFAARLLAGNRFGEEIIRLELARLVLPEPLQIYLVFDS